MRIHERIALGNECTLSKNTCHTKLRYWGIFLWGSASSEARGSACTRVHDERRHMRAPREEDSHKKWRWKRGSHISRRDETPIRRHTEKRWHESLSHRRHMCDQISYHEWMESYKNHLLYRPTSAAPYETVYRDMSNGGMDRWYRAIPCR